MMGNNEYSSQTRIIRKRFKLQTELVLAMLPTLTVVGTLFFLEVFSRQHVLFASLSSSAFLIYMDPVHIMNRIRNIVIAQTLAVFLGFGAHLLIANDYEAAGVSMVLTIILMILLDAVHPPAVATSLTFSFRTYSEHSLVLFGLALGLTIALVILERSAVWLLRHFTEKK